MGLTKKLEPVNHSKEGAGLYLRWVTDLAGRHLRVIAGVVDYKGSWRAKFAHQNLEYYLWRIHGCGPPPEDSEMTFHQVGDFLTLEEATESLEKTLLETFPELKAELSDPKPALVRILEEVPFPGNP